MKGLVVKSTGSWYEVKLSDGEIVRARLRGKFKLVDKKITNPLAVGDLVTLVNINDDFVIDGITDRSNYVIRLSPKKKGHSHLIAANIDQAILMASLKMPKTSLGFVDRFLVSLEAFRIPGILIINKTDLCDEEELRGLDATKELYQGLGYKTILISVENDEISEIGDLLKNKKTLLSGHSGTGKSSLINKLVPGFHQEIGAISNFAEKGIHTTTFAEMFTIDEHSMVIDTPGIKELGLAEIESEELSHYFPEMRSLLGTCKFHDCTHTHEPGCAVRNAYEDGSIHASRYKSYLSILEGDDNRR